ncbi:MAG: GAF domain-containing protein [Anaerolineales bacterium]|nr:GAF domain-containing protein [Anaerolineales bacterium]
MNETLERPSRSLLSRWRSMGLGTRLAITLLPLVLIPMLLLAGVSYFRARNLLETQATSQMNSAAQAQVAVLEEWSSVREQRLQLGSQRSALRDAASDLMSAPRSGSRYENALETVRAELDELRTRQGQVLFSDLALVDATSGTILAGTNDDWLDQASPNLTIEVDRSMQIDTHPVFDDPIFGPGTFALYTKAPFQTTNGDPIFLIGVNSSARLGALMEEMQIFWEQRGVYRVERGRTFVLMAPDVLIQLPRYATEPEAISGYVHPIFDQVGEASTGSMEYIDADGTLVLAAYEWIPEWDLGIVTELPQSDIFAEANDLAPFTILLVLAAIALVGVVVPIATRQSIRPLQTLTNLAERFAMGELSARVDTQREDEIGTLSKTFNAMAEDLSELYRSLEQRVQDRTEQIRTASEVARDAVAIRDVETLLNETVNLITNRFGYYHAGVFLLDPQRENAVLRAASSEGGKRMLQRGHRLPVGKVGIVGYVTGTGKPRIALDVGADQVHFANPDLPSTRSELALPLSAGDQIIGALDVQIEDPQAFAEEDVLVLQTMADQLAVAIENARLISDLTTLSDRNRKVIDVFGSLSQQLNYDTLLARSSDIIRRAFEFNRVAIGIVDGNEVILRSASAEAGTDAAHLGVPVPLDRGPLGRAITSRSAVVLSSGSGTSTDLRSTSQSITIAVPLISRGTAIGALAIESTQSGRADPADVETLELVAGQLATSLENARLFEETQRSLDQLDSLYQRQSAESWDQLLALLGDDKLLTHAEFTSPRYPDAVVDGGDALEVPISIRGEIVGKLDILGKKPGEWTEDEREIVQAVAGEVAVALEQARLLEEVQRRAAQLETAAEVARDATGLLDIDTLVKRTANLILQRFGYQHIGVFLLDEDHRAAVLAEAAGDAGDALLQAGLRIEIGSDSIIGHVTATGEQYLAQDVGDDPLFQPQPHLPDTRAQLVLPLTVGQRVLGALDIQANNQAAFNPDDLAVLQILADQLAVAIQNAQLFQQTLERARREQTVLELSGEIRRHEDVEGMLRTAVQEMRSALGASRSRIRLFEQPVRSEGESGIVNNEEEPQPDPPGDRDGSEAGDQ